MPNLTDIQQGLATSPAYVGAAPAGGPTYPTPETGDAPYQVSPGPLTPPPTPFLAQRYPYLEFGIRTHIVRDPGLQQQEVCGPAGTPCEIDSVHAGKAIKIVVFSALRLGAKCQVPSLNTGSTNEVIGPNHVAFDIPGHLPDGTPIHTMAGVYVYYLQVMPTEADQITLGAAPFTTETVAGNVVGPADYSTTIIGPSPPPVGGAPPLVNY